MDTETNTIQKQEFQDANNNYNKIEYNDNSAHNMINLNIQITNVHIKGKESQNPNFIYKNIKYNQENQDSQDNQNKADLTNQSGEDILVILENKQKDNNNDKTGRTS